MTAPALVPAPAPAPLRAKPASPGELFSVFTLTALQGFGGVLPVAQRTLVDKHGWLSAQEFLELLALAQVLPGPNIVNLALIYGDRCCGWRGALAAVGGLLLAPLVVVLALAIGVAQLRGNTHLDGALRGMGVVAAGLVAGTALRMLRGLRDYPAGLVVACTLGAATLLAVGVMRWPLPAVVAGLGGVSVGLAWWKLQP